MDSGNTVLSLLLLNTMKGGEKVKAYYVYAWFFKDTSEVFYVGKGKNKRAYDVKNHRNNYFKNIINKYQDNVDVTFLFIDLTEDEAFRLEKEMIKMFKEIGECKANFHVGGKGGYTGNYDSKERSEKISKAMKLRNLSGERNPMYHKTHSVEARKKISEANKGKKLSKEHIEKLRLVNTGKKLSQEQIEMRRLNASIPCSKEKKLKISQSLIKYKYEIYLDGEYVISINGKKNLYKYCSEYFYLSHGIIDKIINNTWKPKFKKHIKYSNLTIIEKCID